MKRVADYDESSSLDRAVRLYVRHLAEVVVPTGVKHDLVADHDRRVKLAAQGARLLRDAKEARAAAAHEHAAATDALSAGATVSSSL